jgi:hypothetical protein
VVLIRKSSLFVGYAHFTYFDMSSCRSRILQHRANDYLVISIKGLLFQNFPVKFAMLVGDTCFKFC